MKQSASDCNFEVIDVRWAPAAGLQFVGKDLEDEAEFRREQLSRLEEGRSHFRRLKSLFTGLLIILPLLSALFIWVFYSFLDYDYFLLIPVALYASLFIFMSIFGWLDASSNLADTEAELRKVEASIELDELLENEDLRRAQRLFRLSSIEVKRYHDQGLRQRAIVFLVGMFCILGGFVVIGVALWVVVRFGNLSTTTQILVASLGAVSGILADFVAVIFLRMFGDIIKSSIEFYTRLVETHHAHFANVLAAGIDDPQVRNSTLSRVSMAVLHGDGVKASLASND